MRPPLKIRGRAIKKFIATMALVVVLVMAAMVCAVPDIQCAVDALAQLQANDGVQPHVNYITHAHQPLYAPPTPKPAAPRPRIHGRCSGSTFHRSAGEGGGWKVRRGRLCDT